MPTHRRFTASLASQRPRGPRCHGGASSLLRLGPGALPQRAEADRLSGWLGRPAASNGIEHVLGLPAAFNC